MQSERAATLPLDEELKALAPVFGVSPGILVTRHQPEDIFAVYVTQGKRESANCQTYPFILNGLTVKRLLSGVRFLILNR